MYRLYIILIIWIYCTMCLFAQNAVGGRVTEEATGEALAGANVMLRTDEGKIFKFAISDGNGEFQILLGEKSAEGLTLNVTMVGMLPFSLRISNFDRENLGKLEITLQEVKTELKEITVRAEKIRNEGDTITYLTSSFAKENDRTIGDVLKRMPGIEVDKDGKIKYQGASINKFYVEGNDLLGGKYGIATNGISHTDIGAVEVMENHQPMQVLRGISFSDQAAINLRLKEGAKSTWIVNGDLASGFSEAPKGGLWQGQLFAMMAAQGYQGITTLKSNNIGRDVSREVTDFLLKHRNTDLSKYINAALPSSPNLEKTRVLFNRSHLFSTNHLWKLRGSEVKAQVDYLNNRLTSSSASRTTYFLDDGNQIVNEERQGKEHGDRLTGKFIIEANQPNYYLNNTLNTELQWDRLDISMSGTMSNDEQVSNLNYYVSNGLRCIRKFGQKFLVTFVSQNELESSPQRLVVDYLSEDAPQKQAVQNVSDRAFYTNEYAEFGVSLRQVFLSVEAGVTGYLREMENTKSNYLLLYAAPKLEYLRGMLTMTLSYPITYYKIFISDAAWQRVINRSIFGRGTSGNASPRFSLRLRPLPRLSLSFTAGLRQSPMDLHNIYSGEIMSDYRTFSRGIEDFHLNKAQSLSFYGSYSFPSRGLFANVSASRNWSRTPYRLSQTITDVGFVYTDYANNKSLTMTTLFSGRISKTLDLIDGNFAVGASYMDTQRAMLSQGKNTETGMSSFGVNFSLNGNISSFLGWSYSLNLSDNRMSLNNIKAQSTRQAEHSVLLVILPQKPLRMELAGEYYHNEVQAGKFKDAVFCDAKAIYTLSKRVELMLSVTNLCNKNDYCYTTYGTFSHTESMMKLRGREILLTLHFKK